MMNARPTELTATASTASAGGLVRLQRLEALLNIAREKLALGEALSRADMQRLNAALDDMAAK
ncbi:hypothetical protein [Sphingobium tyrosinilyticum]